MNVTIDLETASDDQLLWQTVRFLENIRAHPRLVAAVKHAARKETRAMQATPQKTAGQAEQGSGA